METGPAAAVLFREVRLPYIEFLRDEIQGRIEAGELRLVDSFITARCFVGTRPPKRTSARGVSSERYERSTMKRSLQAAALPFIAALAIALPACDNEPAPTDPGGGPAPIVTAETCIDCHSNEEALKATAAAVNTSEVSIIAAGDG